MFILRWEQSHSMRVWCVYCVCEMEKVASFFSPNALVFIRMHLGLCATRGCDPTVVDDPTVLEVTRGGHTIDETRMACGMTSLTQVLM